MGLKKLEEDFEKLVKAIENNEMAMFGKIDEYDELVLKQKLFEDNVAFCVAEEKTEDGKSVFSNQQKRDVETRKRLDKSVEYNDLVKSVKGARRGLDTDKITLSSLKRRFAFKVALLNSYGVEYGKD